jgi:hypothetical protein
MLPRMTREEFQAYAKRAALQPFVVKLTDGRLLEVSHPEFVAFPRIPGPFAGTFVFFPTDGGMLVVSLSQVVSLEMLPLDVGERGKAA